MPEEQNKQPQQPVPLDQSTVRVIQVIQKTYQNGITELLTLEGQMICRLEPRNPVPQPEPQAKVEKKADPETEEKSAK